MSWAQVDWLQLVQTFGVAVAVLIVLGAGIWKSAQWFGREIVLPARDRALVRFTAFLDRIEATVTKMDVNVDTVTANLKQQTTSLKGLESSAMKTQEGTVRVAEALEEEHGSLKTLIAQAVTEGKGRHDQLMAELGKVLAQGTLILAKLEQQRAAGG